MWDGEGEGKARCGMSVDFWILSRRLVVAWRTSKACKVRGISFSEVRKRVISSAYARALVMRWVLPSLVVMPWRGRT